MAPARPRRIVAALSIDFARAKTAPARAHPVPSSRLRSPQDATSPPAEGDHLQEERGRSRDAKRAAERKAIALREEKLEPDRACQERQRVDHRAQDDGRGFRGPQPIESARGRAADEEDEESEERGEKNSMSIARLFLSYALVAGQLLEKKMDPETLNEARSEYATAKAALSKTDLHDELVSRRVREALGGS